MSIWEKCEEHNAVPFYGFPVKPSFGNGVITFEFPEGYAPNGSQTQEVADKLKKLYHGEILEVTDTIVKVKANQEYMAMAIYKDYMASK